MDVFGSSGTRGIANREITPEFVCRLTTAVGTVLDTDRVALAWDTRTTGRLLANAASSGLASAGMDVSRLGVVPTPAAQAHAETTETPAVMITASHNPPAYNGVKLVGDDGVELDPATLEEIEAVLESGSFERAGWDGTGSEHTVETIDRQYVDSLCAAVDGERIRDADLTVALDPGHGAGAETSATLFRELGCSVVTVNAQQDGRFPGRDPEPVESNLEDLGHLVRAADADVGIAHDGDADRAVFFDEHGSYIEGDATLAALTAAELDAGDVTVSAVNASQRLVDVVEAADATLELTPVGSTQILSRIRQRQAEGEHVPVAGEGNGGVIFPAYRLARDGAYTAARFVELLTSKPASEVVQPHGGYQNVRRKLVYDTDEERKAMERGARQVAETADATVTTVDGYRLDYGDAWVLARPSGTEPVVRIYAEASRRERAQTLADDLTESLERARNDVRG